MSGYLGVEESGWPHPDSDLQEFEVTLSGVEEGLTAPLKERGQQREVDEVGVDECDSVGPANLDQGEFRAVPAARGELGVEGVIGVEVAAGDQVAELVVRGDPLDGDVVNRNVDDESLRELTPYFAYIILKAAASSTEPSLAE